MKHNPIKRGPDRRERDKGPSIGWKDRRRHPDRRMPEGGEISLAEFEAMLQQAESEKSAQHGQGHGWDKLKKVA